MSDFDFQSESEKLVLALRFLADLRLKEMKEIISMADAVGPIIDPTAYRDMLYRRGGNMHDVGRLIDLSVPLVEEFMKLKEKVDNETNI